MDPAIKLFGKTIPVIGEENGEISPGCESFESSNSDQQDVDDKDEEHPEFQESAEETMEIDQSDDHVPPSEEDSSNPPTMLSTDDSEREPDSENVTEEDTSNDQKNLQQKPLKKPDKILPCPRCNSMDTKFCYYNNYNINQPRHFCKSCQRYWTAGGTMRNVPVGAGRRKNKSSAYRYCHITVSEALQAACLNGPNGVHCQGLQTNGTVLTFGPDNPLCDAVPHVLNISDKQVLNGITARNGFHKIDQVNCRGKENGDDQSSGSIVTTSSMKEKSNAGLQGQIKLNMNGYSNQMPCFQWPYMWNPAVPLLPFCPSAYPMSFYPPPYWNGTIPWNIPWVTPVSPTQKSTESKPNSPTLGKHTRDGEILNQCDQNEKSTGTPTVLVPKTLRIDDPDEAAKSSIWTTLGIKKGDSLSKGGFFNSLPPNKGDEKVHTIEAPPALKANPVALCRSMNFHENA